MRIGCNELRAKIMSPEEAASFITSGSTVGMSGFTGSGYPKAVPLALAARIEAAHAAGNPFKVRVWTGASTGSNSHFGVLLRISGRILSIYDRTKS